MSSRSKAQATSPAKPTVRCAIYTRKSTEDGLQQEFNSLDAQRDAGENYIRSQEGEGWQIIPDDYDDGGFTGGNMDRPALKRLMADIEAGKVDCVVVYKVDRLSRSLLDFSRLLETFEKRRVSFVSVTQQFNTANSMGRLMLNVLLSFAQFEREIISERTRDKIAATRRKGKWSGGMPLLADDGRLKLSHWRREENSALWGTWDTDPRVHGTEPFEIEMQGLGQFLMRRAAWPGFHLLHRGFGGEEGYLHEKIRQRGGRTLCHPAMGWRHRFRDPTAAVPYPASLADHTWNLLVEHRELGIDAEQQIFEHFGKRLSAANWESLVRESSEQQPLKPSEPKPLKILGVWYSNNAAPEKLLQDSLGCLQAAVRCTQRFDVRIVTSSWDPIPGNPLPWIQAPDRDGGHGNIIRQIRQAVAHLGDWSWDVICFLEQDVLYPADYFERVGAAFAATPEANVVSNLDYEGLNATGWLAVKERHEPMHQLSMRRPFALANLDRAEEDCTRQGWAYLEPQGDRSNWLRLPATGKSPSIHVNHARRFTSHGEVCYEAESSRRQHPVWGDFRRWWPESEADFPCIHRGEVLRQVGCGCGARDQRMNVYACRVHRECTIHATGKAGGEGTIRACSACEGRRA